MKAAGSNSRWGEMPVLGKQSSADRLMRSQRKTGPLCSSHLHKGPASVFVARIFCRRELPPVRAAKGGTDFRRYPDAMRFSSNDYFFFFLAVFLAVFFAFFAFLAILPSVIPKVWFNASRPSTCITQSTPQLQN